MPRSCPVHKLLNIKPTGETNYNENLEYYDSFFPSFLNFLDQEHKILFPFILTHFSMVPLLQNKTTNPYGGSTLRSSLGTAVCFWSLLLASLSRKRDLLGKDSLEKRFSYLRISESHRCCSPLPCRVADSIDLGWGLKICISNKCLPR